MRLGCLLLQSVKFKHCRHSLCAGESEEQPLESEESKAMEEGVADELEMLEVGDAPLLAWPGLIICATQAIYADDMKHSPCDNGMTAVAVSLYPKTVRDI